MKHLWIWKVLAAAVLIAGLLFGQAKQPKLKSKKEQDAVMAIFNAPDAASKIKAVEALLVSFADTEFKAVALQIAAMSAAEINDFEKMVIYAERTLEADPKNYEAMLLLAGGLANRTREFDLYKEEKLGRAEKYADGALEAINSAEKPNPNITDEQWAGAKKDYTARALESKGLIAMARKKYDDAIANFKTSIDTAATQDPATKLRLAAAYNGAGKYDDAIAMIDQLTADQNLHPTIRQLAGQEKMKAVQGKAKK